MKQAYIGLKITNIKGQWMVTSADPQGEGYKTGIRLGDVMFKIDGQDPGYNTLVQKWSEVEGASTLEIRKGNGKEGQLINIPAIPIWQNILSQIPFTILGFVFWFSGFVTWFRRPFLAQARALFWFNWCAGLAALLAPASSRNLLFVR